MTKNSSICFVKLWFTRYIGELISDSEADSREDDSYLFDLDNRVSTLILLITPTKCKILVINSDYCPMKNVCLTSEWVLQIRKQKFFVNFTLIDPYQTLLYFRMEIPIVSMPVAMVTLHGLSTTYVSLTWYQLRYLWTTKIYAFHASVCLLPEISRHTKN